MGRSNRTAADRQECSAADATGNVSRLDAGSSSPFVAMSAWQRHGIIIFYVAYVLAVMAIPVPSGQVEIWYNRGALVLRSLAVLAPLMFYRGRAGWFHPLVFMAVYGVVGMARQFPTDAWGLSHHRALPELGPTGLTLLHARYEALAALGLVCLFAGFWLGKGFTFRTRRFVRPADLPLRAAIALGLSLCVAAFFVARGDGVSAFLSLLGRGRHQILQSMHYLVLPASIGTLGACIWLAHRPRQAVRSPYFWAIAGVSALIPGFVSFSRGAVLYAVAAYVIVYLLRVRRMMFVRPVLGAVLGIYFLSVAGDLRQGTWRGNVDFGKAAQRDPVEALQEGGEELAHRAASGHGGLAVLARVPRYVDHEYGRSYLAALTNPIPRALWPEKPGLVGGRVGALFFHMTGGVPPGAVGEAYWNFGIPGVVLAFFLGGIVIRVFANWYVAHADEPISAVVYAVPLFKLAPTTDNLVSNAKYLALLVFVALVLFGIKPVRVEAEKAPVAPRGGRERGSTLAGNRCGSRHSRVS